MKFIVSLCLWLATATVALSGEQLVVNVPATPAAVVAEAPAADAGPTLAAAPAEAPKDAVLEVVQPKQSFWQQLLDGGFLAQLGMFFVLLLGVLRALSELLVWVSSKTENTWDNKLASIVTDATWYLGVLVSKAGWGTPKAIVAEKAKEAASGGPKAA